MIRGGNGASHNACLDLNSEDGWSKDFERDTPSPNLDSRRGWELRCIVLGIILVAFVVVGVFVAVLSSRAKGEYFFLSDFENILIGKDVALRVGIPSCQ